MNKPNIKSEITSLESIEDSPEFQLAIERDFGAATEELNDGLSRRRWLQLMGASLALGGMSGCRYQEEKIVPFAFRPQNRIPGIPQKYASVIDFDGIAQPILATCFDGRPIKLDGNPDHPTTHGASSVYTQARILDLYDPERMRTPLIAKDGSFVETNWETMLEAWSGLLQRDDLSGVGILAENVGSPSLDRIRKQLQEKGAKWYTYTSINNDNTRAGCKAAFGKAYRLHYALEQANVIVSLDADPLGQDGNALDNNQKFIQGRDADHGTMNRLYAIESQFTMTGASADHRMSVPSTRIGNVVSALSKAIASTSEGAEVDRSLGYRERMLACIAQDLVDNRGASVIICGERQPPEVHAAVHSLNVTLDNIGKTIQLTQIGDVDGDGALANIQQFAADAKSGVIDSLVIIGGNPVFGAPISLNLGDAIVQIENSIHLSQYKNETSVCCKWICNVAHELESWTDGWAYDGSLCIGQPLIKPLFEGKSIIETLAVISDMETTDGLEIVQQSSGLSDQAWDQAVHDGFVTDSAARPVDVSFSGADEMPMNGEKWNEAWDGSTFEIVFKPCSTLYDGRFANNAWLQELPDFHTKLTWDNAAVVSPKTAEKFGWRTQQVISITLGDSTVRLPVVIQPGQADGSIGLTLGYGRTMAGRVGGDVAKDIEPVGTDVNILRTVENWHFAEISKPVSTGTIYKLALVQEPWDIDETGRNEIQARMFRDRDKKEGDRSSLIREGSFDSYRKFMKEHPGDHDQHSNIQAETDQQVTRAKITALPVINNVSYVAPEEQEHADDHGHVQWPEAFHLHHASFDITPGAREDYKQSNPAHTNMWGMAIDLNKCTGCNACVIACQAENNIPVVGKAQVWRGREMHWLRMDRYYGSNLYNDEAAEHDDKQMVHQPVTCHHCENAPCETVCPVAATTHSREGLNDMVYNRCIGTRYCGNNCPYKVRRFNYFNYSDAVTFLKYPGADKLSKSDRNIQNLMMNPEVTIRSRGVMEKCTFCVQRIQNTKIKAKTEGNRPIGPNEITTACQDACATHAITFGDLNNLESDVRKAHDSPRAYTLLEGLNNYPRTRYLARVRNLNKALVDSDDRHSVRGHNEPDRAGEAEATKKG